MPPSQLRASSILLDQFKEMRKSSAAGLIQRQQLMTMVAANESLLATIVS
jgi:hypothetical protein